MREALDRAHQELGANATILHTKLFEEPALFGFSRNRGVEILAAVDSPAPAGGVPVITSATPVSQVESMTAQISDMKHILARMAPSPAPEPEKPKSVVFERLLKNGVSHSVAESVAALLNSEQDNEQILNKLAQRVPCSGPVKCDKRQARIALVGPTGVGKTTTAAKLAAHYAIVEKKKVALLTLDTYRVGAVEQLSTYARILNVPIEVALCPEDVDAMIQKHKDKDVIVIDTVGRSQRNSSQLSELANFVRAANPTEVHLVISASSSQAVQTEAVDNFRKMSADRLILTKLDESPLSGCILDLAVTTLLPFSYITYGQEVPDDISVAEKGRLARLVWEGMP